MRTIKYCDIYVTNYAIYVPFGTIKNSEHRLISRSFSETQNIPKDNTEDWMLCFLIVSFVQTPINI